MPIFLTPRPGLNLSTIESPQTIRIHFQDDVPDAWTIHLKNQESPAFSFDLPLELFKRYKKNGLLTPEAALDLKTAHFGQITALHIPQTANQPHFFTFHLDPDWISQQRTRLTQRRRT